MDCGSRRTLCSPEVAVDTQVGHIRRTVEESHNLEEGALHNPEEEAHHNLAGNRAGHHIDRGEDFAGTGDKATGCSREEGAALVEVGRTAEVGAMTEEGVQVDESMRIWGDSREY